MEATFEESFRLMKEERHNCVRVLYRVISKKNRKPEQKLTYGWKITNPSTHLNIISKKI